MAIALEAEAMRQGPREDAIVALDVGTTGVRALLLDATGTPRAEAYREVLPHHPGPGLVEHDPEATFAAIGEVVRSVLAATNGLLVRGLGLGSQRSTAVVWEAVTGRPVHPALSWQDGRTAERCRMLL